MNKFRRAACVWLTGVMAATFIAGNVLAFAKTGGTELVSDAQFNGVEFTDVTGKVDVTGLAMQNLSQSVLENAGYNVSDSGKRTVIVKLGTASVADSLPEGESVTEYLASYAGSKKVNSIKLSQTNFLNSLSSLGVKYNVVYQYTNVVNAVAIEVDTAYLSAIKSIANVKAAYVSETYAVPEDITAEDVVSSTQSNYSNVYATGIYNSSEQLASYDGSGITVAIIDSGFDYTHEAFTTYMPETISMNRAYVASRLNDPNVTFRAVERSAAKGKNLTVNDLYINDKVPFAYDYADKDPDVYPSYSLHGTHVAGIVAGHADSYKDKNGNVVNEEFLGVAPNAQLVICKTFTDDLESDDLGGATTEDLIAALDDCVALGVDIINMSLGTASGFSSGFMDADDEGQLLDAAYGAVKEVGINLICAASNEYSAGFGSVYGTNLATNPDSGTVGSPSTFWGAVSVASVNGQTSPFMVANAGTNYASSVFYSNSSDVNAVTLDFIKMLYEKSDAYKTSGIPYSEVKSYSETFKYVVVNNFGQPADYTASVKAQLADKSQGRTIALVKRGTTTFEAKIRTAMESGADAIIIYNNVAGSIGMSVGEIEDPIPSVSITLDEGIKLLYNDRNARISTGLIEVNIDYQAGPFMNEYSSWGTTPDLKLKPDVTAHGGEITSTVPGGYDEMSGTSMASPNLAGFAALLRSYVKQNLSDIHQNDPVKITQLSNQILMSTATTVYDKYGLPYSPRKQGSGLATLKNAFSTQAYLWTDEENGGAEDNRPKIELGEDEGKSAKYTFSFYVSNFGGEDLGFTAKSNFFTESLSADGLAVAEKAHYLTDNEAVWVISENGASSRSLANGEEFTVKSGEYAKITVTLELSNAEKEYMENFPNGMFVEGFITLASSNSAQCDLNLPFMGFYGDWEAAPMLDYSVYEIAAAQQDPSIPEEKKPQATVWETQAYANYYNNKYSVPMGSFSYIQDPDAEQIYANTEYAAISRYNWYYGEDEVSNYLTTYEIRALYAGLLRNAAIVTYDLFDTETGELITQDNIYRVGKAYAAGGASVPAQVLLELEPEALGLVNNGKYSLNFYFYFNEEQYNEGIRDKGNTFAMTFYVDYEAPVLAESRIRYTDYKDTSNKDRQRAYLDLDIYDNTYAQSVILCYSTADDPNDTTELRLVTQYITPVLNPVKNGTTTVSIEITDLLADYAKYKDRLYIQIDDYALNHRVLKLNFTNSNANPLPSEFEILGGTDITVGVNETYKVALSYEGNANLSNFTWTTNSERYVRVYNGEIFGVEATGRFPATVTVYGANNSQKTINVTVVDRGTKLTFPSTLSFGMITSSTENLVKATGTVTVNAGQTFTLDVTADPWYYSLSDYTLTWESSNENIAVVDQNGTVTVKNVKGIVGITATIYDGSMPKCFAKVSLNVLDPFTISNFSLTKYSGTDEIVVIPADKNITSIGEEAFKDNTTARVIIIPKTVTTINAKAFLNCTALEEVYFIQEEPLAVPDSALSTIMRYAFSGCENLRKIDLSNCKTITVDRSAFEGCSKLEEIVKMENIGTMYNRAFYGCTSLTDIDITGLHVAGTQVFANCTSLSTVKTGYYTAIGEYMFYGCSALEEITLNARTVEANAFRSCANLTTVNFGVSENGEPVSDTYVIGAGAFYGCSNLTTLNFNGKAVTDIGDMAFANCTRLTSFTLPEGLENLGDRVFYGTDVTFVSASSNYKVVGGAVYSGTTLLIAPKSVPSGFALQSGTTAIGPYAFSGCTFASGTISLSGVTKIGEGAFANTNLNAITIPSGVTEISDHAFYGTDITSVNIPASVIKIGTGAFYDCLNLKTITFADGSQLTSIGDAAFAGTAITTIVLPDGVKTMGSSVFEFCLELTEVTMPSVTSLGMYTFSGCSSLEKVTFGSNASTLGEYTFAQTTVIVEGRPVILPGCVSLTTVVIGDKTTYIGEGVFMGCTSLESINLNNVTEVGAGAFYMCTALTEIDLTQLEYIGEYAFYACSSLEELSLDSAKVIGGYAFYAETVYDEANDEYNFVSGYETVKIPVAVSIGDMAFFGGMEETVEIPASLTTLGYGAFANSVNLTSFTVEEGNNIFFAVDGVLYRVLNTVAGYADSYELTAYPSAKVAEADADGSKTYTVIDETVTVKAYALSFLSDGAVEKVVLPYSIKTIGDAAFFESGITEYQFEAINAPSLLSEFYYLDDVLVDSTGEPVYLADFSHYMMFARNFNFGIAYYTNTILASPLTSTLKIYYPSNGLGYDNYTYSCYFGTKISLGEIMDDNTRALKKIIEEQFYSLDEINEWNSLEINDENTLMVSNFALLVISAHELYNVLASDYQLELLGEENVDMLFAVESALKPVKARFGIAATAESFSISETSTHRTVYTAGEKFDMTGLVLIVEYSDFTSELADMNYVMLESGYDKELSSLSRYVYVQGTGEYAGLRVSIPITVNAADETHDNSGGHSSGNLLGLWIALGVVGGLVVLAAVAYVVLRFAFKIDVIAIIFKKKSVAPSVEEAVSDDIQSDGGENKEE